MQEHSHHPFYCPLPESYLIHREFPDDYQMSEDTGDIEKQCSCCQEFLSVDTEFWYAHSSNPSGLQKYCKACSHDSSRRNAKNVEPKTSLREKKRAINISERDVELVDLIGRYALEGKTLVALSSDTGISYDKIKRVSQDIGHVHPRGIDQLELRFRFERGTELEEYVKHLALTGFGLYRAAAVLGIDKSSLEQFARLRKIKFDPILIKSAIRCAKEGLTLRDLAIQKNMTYSCIKMRLARAGYKHPYGIELTKNRILWQTGLEFDDEIKRMIAEGRSRNEIAIHFKIDNATLRKYALEKNITFNVSKPIPRNFNNIISAIKKRQKKRKDLVWIKFNNDRLYLEQWSRKSGIKRGTIQKRLNLGFSVDEALTTPIRSRRGFSTLNSLKTSVSSKSASSHEQ